MVCLAVWTGKWCIEWELRGGRGYGFRQAGSVMVEDTRRANAAPTAAGIGSAFGRIGAVGRASYCVCWEADLRSCQMRSIQAAWSGFIRTERRQVMVSRPLAMAGPRLAAKNFVGSSARARWR